MIYNNEIMIGERLIAKDQSTYFIADIAANHDNDIERAKALIWSAAEAGADAAKFQHFEAKTIVSDLGFKTLGSKMSHQSKWEKSVYETYQDAQLNIDWTETLAKTCGDANIDFLTSPYSLPLVDKVDDYVPAYKIGSGDITFEEIVEYIARKDKPVILATGASTIDDVRRAVDTVLTLNKDIILLQCNTNYTGSIDNFHYVNLNVLNTFKGMYPGMMIGLSDHTPGCATVLGAIALGARVIEKHYTDDNNRKGPDHPFSMTPVSWMEMVDRSRELEAAMGNGKKIIEDNEKESVVLQRRCLRVVEELPVDHKLSENDLVALRPSPEQSYSPYEKKSLVGKVLTKHKKSGDAILSSDIQ